MKAKLVTILTFATLLAVSSATLSAQPRVSFGFSIGGPGYYGYGYGAGAYGGYYGGYRYVAAPPPAPFPSAYYGAPRQALTGLAATGIPPDRGMRGVPATGLVRRSAARIGMRLAIAAAVTIAGTGDAGRLPQISE